MSVDEIVEHIVDFVTLLWQNHPFCEGNTRTTAVFVIKYLRSIGFNVDNELFAHNSWYFRNALVRANYRNPLKGIEPDKSFLIQFFRNLMLGELHELKNRYLLIGYKQPNNTPTSTPTSSKPKFNDLSDAVKRLVLFTGNEEKSVTEMLHAFGLKDRKSFLKYTLTPAIADGLVKMKYPNSPRHPRQKYLLTVKGLAVYNSFSSNY